MSKTEKKGLEKPLKLKKELAQMMGAEELSRAELTKRIWDHIKSNKLQTKTKDGKPTGEGKLIVADKVLLPILRNTKSTSKSGNVTDLTQIQEGQTFDMMQVASVIGCNLA